MLKKVSKTTKVLKLLTIHHSRLSLLLIHKRVIVLLCLLIGFSGSA